MTALWLFIIVNIIFGLLSLHWVLSEISLHQNQKDWLLKKRLLIHWGGTANLMLGFLKFNKSDAEFSNGLMINAFGFKVIFLYGNDFTDGETKIFRLGFCSKKGELIWNQFYFGQNIFNSPWDTSAIPVLLESMTPDGTFSDKLVPWYQMNYVNYLGKNNRMTTMEKVDVYLIVKQWTSKIGYLLRLGDIFKTRVIYIALRSEQKFGSSEMNCVPIYLNDKIDILYEQYIKTSKSGGKYRGLTSSDLYDCMKEYVKYRIGLFMMGECIY